MSSSTDFPMDTAPMPAAAMDGHAAAARAAEGGQPVPLEACHAADLAALEALCFPCGWSAEQFARELGEGRCWGYGFPVPREQGLQLAGYILCASVLDEMEILNVGVLPELRGRQIATQLLHRALQEAGERRIVKCCLEVRAGNVPARALYARAGFVQVGIRRHYYADTGEDALVMVLELDW